MSRPKQTTIINIYGGPGSGKSTTAAGVFYRMKLAGFSVELVREYAKDLVYRGTLQSMSQRTVTAQQSTREQDLVGQVDYIVTDSPVALGIVYSASKDVKRQIEELVNDLQIQPSINFLMNRNPLIPYNPEGRLQTEEESKKLDWEIYQMLLHRNEPVIVCGDKFQAVDRILDHVIQYEQGKAILAPCTL